MMQLATHIKKANDFGVQLILNESQMVIGINLVCDKKILVKHRFNKEIEIVNATEENRLVNKVLTAYLSAENINTINPCI